MRERMNHDDATRDLDDTAWMEPSGSSADLPTRTRELGLPAPRWRLVVREGPEKGREIELPTGRVSLGRSGRCAIRLEDPSISRLHLWVEGRPEGVLFSEESTKNGTTLDGAPCLEGIAKEGQRIALGQTVLEVRLGTGKAAGPPNIVEQAFRVMRGELPPRPKQATLTWGTLLLCACVVVVGIVVAVRGGPAPIDEGEEGASGEIEARKAFDRGIELLKQEAFEEARPLFALAAREDPQSEEPSRYLGWLDASEEAAWEDEAPSAEEAEAAEAHALDSAHKEAVSGVDVAADEPPPSERRPEPRKRAVVRQTNRAPEPREEARQEIREMLERARGEEGLTAIASLRAAWEKARRLRGEESLVREVGEQLAERSFAVGEDALLLGRLPRAVSHFRLTLEARPGHALARERLGGLKERAESFLVEGYSLRERDPARAREWLELVLALTDARDPLHQRASRWLADLGPTTR